MVWVQADGPTPGMGVQFLDMAPATAEALAQYAEEVAKKTTELTMQRWIPTK